MAARRDILIDDNFTPRVQNGDFVVGDSDDQHVQLILLSAPGDWRQTPLLGVDIVRYLKSPDNQVRRFERDAKLHLLMDGYEMQKLTLNDGLRDFHIEHRLIDE